MAEILKDGQAVRGPGQYIASMDHYHTQAICPGISVSSSGLRTIINESPADFWAFCELNEHRYEKDTIPAFTFGRAAHNLLLGDEVFAEKFAVIPEGSPPNPTTAQIAARELGRISDEAAERFGFWDAFNAKNFGKEFIKAADMVHVSRIHDSIAKHPLAPTLLKGEAEQSLIWQDDVTGLWVKVRLDVLSATGDLVDLKSTARKGKRLIMADVRARGYDMQLGLATMAMENVLGVPFTPEEYAGRAAVLVFVYKSPPYHVMPIEVSYEALHWARLKCRRALNTMANCLLTDHWPGETDGIPVYDLPDWELEEIALLQEAKLFPTDAYEEMELC